MKHGWRGMVMKKTKDMWLDQATVDSLSRSLCVAHKLRNKLVVSSDAWFQRAPDSGKRCGVGWMFVDESAMWNAEAGSLMNFRRNRAPATAPASCIFPASQSRTRFAAVFILTQNTPHLHQRGLPVRQPPKYENMPPLAAINLCIHYSFGALRRLLIHRQTLVPTHACISFNVLPGPDPP